MDENILNVVNRTRSWKNEENILNVLKPHNDRDNITAMKFVACVINAIEWLTGDFNFKVSLNIPPQRSQYSIA